VDAKLKLKLNEAVDAALAYWKKTGGPTPKPVDTTTDSVVQATDTESDALTRWLTQQVRQKLYRTAEWERIESELAMDALAQIFAKKLKLRWRQSPDEHQLTLPGFEHLPRSVRIGKARTRVELLKQPVPWLLNYEERYRFNAQRNQQTAEELNRLALEITPYKETDLNVAEAFERARTQKERADVVVLVPRTA
jgi:hypothetical protein